MIIALKNEIIEFKNSIIESKNFNNKRFFNNLLRNLVFKKKIKPFFNNILQSLLSYLSKR